MVSAIDSVIRVSEEQLIPVISGEDSCVRAGALATIGINYSELGYQSGKMAAKILRGEAIPSEMAIEGQSKYTTVVNSANAAMLKITLPQALLDRADEILE